MLYETDDLLHWLDCYQSFRGIVEHFLTGSVIVPGDYLIRKPSAFRNRLPVQINTQFENHQAYNFQWLEVRTDVIKSMSLLTPIPT